MASMIIITNSLGMFNLLMRKSIKSKVRQSSYYELFVDCKQVRSTMELKQPLTRMPELASYFFHLKLCNTLLFPKTQFGDVI